MWSFRFIFFVMLSMVGGVSVGCVVEEDPSEQQRRAYDGGPLPDYDGSQCIWADEVARGVDLSQSAMCCQLGVSVARENSCLQCDCSYNVAATPVWRCVYEADACNMTGSGDSGLDGGPGDAGG